MLLSTSFSFRSSQLAKDIHTPPEGIVVPLVAVQLIEGVKLSVGNNKIWNKGY
jgi:hypothetical protein